ncbi:unnamed protein product [Urochloa humidicola]
MAHEPAACCQSLSDPRSCRGASAGAVPTTSPPGGRSPPGLLRGRAAAKRAPVLVAPPRWAPTRPSLAVLCGWGSPSLGHRPPLGPPHRSAASLRRNLSTVLKRSHQNAQETV